MKRYEYKGILIQADAEITPAEIQAVIDDEIRRWPRKLITKIEIRLDGDELVIVPRFKIHRTRRISGYLSDTDNWNKAKQAELRDRVKHM